MTIITEIQDQELDAIKSMVIHVLSSQVATVKFTKVDGTERVMKATLDAKFIKTEPIVEGTEPKVKRKSNDDVQAVYDVEAGAWKSFRWGNLISISTGDKQ